MEHLLYQLLEVLPADNPQLSASFRDFTLRIWSHPLPRNSPQPMTNSMWGYKKALDVTQESSEVWTSLQNSLSGGLTKVSVEISEHLDSFLPKLAPFPSLFLHSYQFQESSCIDLLHANLRHNFPHQLLSDDIVLTKNIIDTNSPSHL